MISLSRMATTVEVCGGLSGPDHPDEARLLLAVALDHAQPSGQQEIELVGRLLGVEQHPPARQGEPGGLRRAFVPEEHPREGGVLQVFGKIHHATSLASPSSLRQTTPRA
jgi:hypothetical protein